MGSLIKKPKTFQEKVNELQPQSVATPEQLNKASTQKVEGGVSQGGKFYPTTNPDFVPDPNATDIKFNAGGGVTISPKGTSEKINLTKEEYTNQQNLEMGRGGNLTNKAKEVTQALNPPQQTAQLGLTPEQIAQAEAQATEASIDKGQAATAGAAQAVPGIIGGAVSGATIGALGGPVGAVGGAIVGGVATFLNGIRGNIKSQQSGEIASTKETLSSAKTNMRQLTILASKDPKNADEYISLYNQQLANVYQARAKLKLETRGNLNKFMNDGTKELAEFDSFLAQDGLSNTYKLKLQLALAGGTLDFTEEELANTPQ
jgi:hypothetical protein